MSNAALPAGAIRVVLAGIPGLTAGLVRRCMLDQSDISIVGELRHAGELAALARGQPIDVVVTALTRDGVPAGCQELLFDAASVPVIAVGSDGRLEVYDRRVLREAALDELLAEIRRVATRTEATPSA